MNNTNRVLNRLGPALLGLVALLIGATVVVAALIPEWLSAWRDGAAAISAEVPGVTGATELGDTGQSWLLLAIAAAAVVLIALLIVFVFRQGHGHTGVLFSRTRASGPADLESASAPGSLTVNSSLAERSIAAALAEYPGVASASVSTYSVAGTATLKIVVAARRGVSPRDVRENVDEIVRDWDEVFGHSSPVFVKITGGFASRVAGTSRLPERAAAPSALASSSPTPVK